MLAHSIGWLQAQDLRLCLAVNRAAGAWTVRTLRVVSRLGDGLVWIALVPALWLAIGRPEGLHLLGALGTGSVVYRIAKQCTGRARPNDACPDVRLLAAPLDRYSFPSGHTLHAVAASVVVTAAVPAAGLVVWPLTAAIAASRVVLGLHYPSDVLAGALVGAAIGWLWV